jgi:DNA-binding NarL/FixJ family response regulator
VSAASPTRVLLVDDHAMVRRGLREFLGLFDDIEVVGEAADGREALTATETLRPDVVVMDLNLPLLDGVEATRELRAAHPEVEVVALTGTVEEERVMAAIEAGAAGFLLKDAEPDEVAAAIRAARDGEMYLAPAVAGVVARQLRAAGAPVTAADDLSLTPRERDVLGLVAEGLPNRAIGDALGITERTARTHVSNILAKLGLTSRTQAALYAVEQGLDGDGSRASRRRP